MQERRAADTLWMELRGALLAEARERSLDVQRVNTDQIPNSDLRLQDGKCCLQVHAAREVVTCTIWIAADPDSRREVPIGLHPGSIPSFRLNGCPQPAQRVAAQLMAALFDHES